MAGYLAAQRGLENLMDGLPLYVAPSTSRAARESPADPSHRRCRSTWRQCYGFFFVSDAICFRMDEAKYDNTL